MTSPSVDVIRRLNAAFNTGDSVAWNSLVDPEVEFVDHLPLPDVAQEAHGIEAVGQVLEQWREGFAGFRAEVEEYIDLGDYVICDTRWRFTSRDGGLRFDWLGAEAHHVRAGKLVWSAAGFRDTQTAIREVERRRAGLSEHRR